MKKSFFAVDLGATSGRTLLATFTEKGMEQEVLNRFPNHLIQARGHYYWDIYELYRNILEGLKIAAQRKDTEIISIGIDTWGCDFAMLARDGHFLRLPYSYRDPQTENAPRTFFAKVPRNRVYNLTGIQVMNFNTLFQIDVLRRKYDSALEMVDKILFIPDALSYLLTGEKVCEYTIASTSQLINARTRRLEIELLMAVGLEERNFGKFVYPGQTIGKLTKEVQELTGLGPIPVVAVAGHDTASAVAAVPATLKDFAYLSSGTWSLMGVESPQPIINADAEALNFTNEGGVERTIRVLKNICGMWLLERCRLKWGDAPYDVINAEAREAEPFRSIINPDDPMFANPADMEEAIKEYCRQHGEKIPETRGQVVRCIYESLALRYRQVLDKLRTLTNTRFECLHIIGGGSRNEMLNQWTANAIGIPVIAGPVEATAIGNVMVQAIAAGMAKDVKSMRRMIHDSIPLSTYNPQFTESWNVVLERLK